MDGLSKRQSRLNVTVFFVIAQSGRTAIDRPVDEAQVGLTTRSTMILVSASVQFDARDSNRLRLQAPDTDLSTR